MRVDELTGIKHLRNLAPQQVIDWLQTEFDAGRSKLRPLGRGSNGVALTNGTDVFKFWMFDSAYESFVEFCLKNQDNPYLPKFHSKIRTLPRIFNSIEAWNYEGNPIDASKVKYVKMEMLEPFKHPGFTLFADQKIRAKIEEEDDLANYVSAKTLMECGTEFNGNYQHDLMWLIEDLMMDIKGFDAPYLQYIKHINPEVMNFITALGSIAEELGADYEFDPGDRNLAMRGKQIVFLDPVVDDADMDLNDRFLSLADIVIKKT